MTLSSGEPVFGFAASFERALAAGFALLFSWANRWPELQIENVTMAPTIHFEKRMSTDLYPGVTPPKDRPTCALLQVSTCRMPGVECRLWWAEFPRRIRATRLVEGTMI